MSFDGIVVRSITKELKDKLINGRVDKIYQTDKEELFINIRNNRERYKLYISASGSGPRMYLTEHSKENPKTAPTFCMLLRKHLENSVIVDVIQYKMDRIIKIVFKSIDELGTFINKALVIEIMGKHSNIILINDETKKIYDAVKRINFNLSSVREILPGLTYSEELISTAKDPTKVDNLYDFLNKSDKNLSIKKFLMSNFTGISPQIVNEISFRTNIDSKRIIGSLDESEKIKINKIFIEMFGKISKDDFNPIRIIINDTFKDFHAIDLKQYNEKEKEYVSSISSLLDEFYYKKLSKDEMKNKSYNIYRKLKNELSKLKKKRENQISELNEALDREKYKIYADLISSNFYKIEKGDKFLIAENYYDNMNEIKIPLDEKIDGPANAAKYYKKYSKLKNAAKILEDEIKKDKVNIEYIESVLLNLELAENSNDLEEIKEELTKTGYLKNNKKNSKSKKENKMKFLEFNTEDGFKIYVGKNNRQNEYLTFKLANKDDLWFHVKIGAGSHVILKNDNREFSNDALNTAAALAAKYSSLKESQNIEVDFTNKSNVKRHPSRKLGLVIYDDFRTINVKRDNEFVK